MNDGTMECWGSHLKCVSANSDDSSIWVNLPSGFTGTPVVTYGVIAGGADLYRAHIVSKDAVSIRFIYTNKHTAAVTITTDIYAIGRWK